MQKTTKPKSNPPRGKKPTVKVIVAGNTPESDGAAKATKARPAKRAKPNQKPAHTPPAEKAELKPTPKSNKNWRVIDTRDMSPEEIAKVMRKEVTKRIPNPKPAPTDPEASATPQAEKEPADEAKPKLGRPSKYTPELAREICIRMASGETLRQVCRDDHMPAASTVRGWVVDNVDGFSEHYARARVLLAEHWADEIVDISDDGTNDWMEKFDQEGNLGWKVNGEHVTRSKLRTENRKWLLSKALPKVYGDKLDVNHGVQPDNPLASLIQRIAGTGLPVVPENTDSNPD